ncbi:hypothetical protein K8O68_07260 [Salipaludibacillus sp. CUR1]|uniref:hypothetical protein n=1 Tax=Salipaludibacillus sp. CUR1 TaxID=2820003 RepID=UPI001E2CB6A7|nr:hypothetical protein [Salipaludibacillus sp. CUR1]MCE7792223.1 hypothetical protein [Salipaludibacillus sp. CUR1]
MKRFILVPWLLMILTAGACGGVEDNNEKVQVIEGRYAFGSYPELGLLMFFVEDTFAGKDYTYLYNDRDIDLNAYKTEAYLLNVTDETQFLDAASSEEIHPAEGTYPFEYANQRMKVEVGTEFERKWTEASHHISYQNALLPIVKAEKIYIEPYSSSDYISFIKPEDNRFIYFIKEESYDDAYWRRLMLLSESLHHDKDVYLDVRYMPNDQVIDYLEMDEPSEYVIVSSEGELMRSSDRETAETFLEAELGVKFPEEGAENDQW